jgi:hypothetical protein
LAPLIVFFNTTCHITIRTTPFQLTYDKKPRLSSLPDPELNRLEVFVSECLQMSTNCKKTRHITAENRMKAGEVHKTAHHVKAKQHDVKEGD